jgi:hypothetical protein
LIHQKWSPVRRNFEVCASDNRGDSSNRDRIFNKIESSFLDHPIKIGNSMSYSTVGMCK